MGEVYRARDTAKNRIVALKILREQFAEDDHFRARFLRESHAAAILQEPHVIPIHDWGEADGNLYIDMRLVEGKTIYDLLADGRLDPDRAVKLMEQTAAALDAAHGAGLIHRDVKPQNIIVTPADFAYLVDFGIVESKGDARLTMDGTQIGSLAYMAPERFADAPTTPAADIYSLACVLYETLTGSTPFNADSYERLITSHLTAAPPRASVVNSGVPAALDDVISRGMAKDPHDRYATASELTQAARRALSEDARVAAASAETMAAPIPLSAITDGAVTRARTAEPTDDYRAQSHARPPRHWLLPVIFSVVAVLVLGALGVVIVLLMGQRTDGPGTDGPPAPTASPGPTLIPPPRPTYTIPETTVVRTQPTVTVTESLQPTPAAIPTTQRRPAAVSGLIVGTCDEGGSCGVKQRVSPYIQAGPLYPAVLRDGANVTVACLTYGDIQSNQGRGSSAIWYRLNNGAYVNSVYLDVTSYGIPAC
jgi:serine/threonine-protein kinase